MFGEVGVVTTKKRIQAKLSNQGTTCMFVGYTEHQSRGKSPFELLYVEKPKLHDNLKMFGEVGVVTTKERVQAKLCNQGTTFMFVVYTEHHSKNVCRMLNLTTNSIINSRDIIWLNKNYREWKDNKATISNVEDDTIELPTGVDKIKLTESATKETEDERNKSNKKVFGARGNWKVGSAQKLPKR
jgi:hypothetical protein